MARGRMISKSLSTSQKRAELHTTVPALAEFCQQLYPLLVAHADDFGRLSGDPFTVKHAVDPTSPRPQADFEHALQALHDVGLIVWYVGDGTRRVVQITQFEPHQTGLHKRTASKFPQQNQQQEKFPEIPSEQKGTELNRTKNVSSAPQSDAKPPALLVFPTVGKGAQTWDLTQAAVDEWQALYPNLSVLGECRGALAWVRSHQPKTAKGMPAFLVNWFNRATARGGNSRPQASAVNGSTVRTEYSPAVLKRIQQAGGR